MNVQLDHNNDAIVPDGYRWVNKGEIIRKGDMFAYVNMWAEVDMSIGNFSLVGNELIRRTRYEDTKE